ncbi:MULTISPECIES: HAD-IA family hydrolase [unclassified Ruegeria]|uniref:HAD family hydrolase n=1 Tax=unclassified Ruegeria TaxID=2625375 RepID=UPI001488C5E3
MASDTVIAWDFDGVLNQNIRDGVFLWAQQFEEDLGQSLDVFTKHIFRNDFDRIITGQEDLRDRVAEWATMVGFAPGANTLLDYWFRKDALPDPAVTDTLDAISRNGVRQVIATNNESRRVSFIEREMGFAKRVDRVFSSGRMGVRKPQPEFYAKVTETLRVSPDQMLLVDDYAASIEAARDAGWRAYLFNDETRGDILESLRAEFLNA